MSVALNEYRISFADNHEETFMAESMRSCVNAKETDSYPIAQVQRIRTGIGVESPVRNVQFHVLVVPDTAKSGGCLGTPEAYIVKEGTEVIFTAIPAAGFTFTGWYLDDVLVSPDALTVIPVAAPVDPDALYVEYEARFAPV
jgi:hypothetical protein